MKSWKSCPNINLNCDLVNNPLRRYNSYHQLSSDINQKPPPKLLARDPRLNSESLTFLLTTATDEKPIHERMMTLTLSRDWLRKELKSMREEDRKLARQFIQLRSAIVELREYFEKDDSEYESECEGTHKGKKIELKKERKIPIHNTPSRNILSYC